MCETETTVKNIIKEFEAVGYSHSNEQIGFCLTGKIVSRQQFGKADLVRLEDSKGDTLQVYIRSNMVGREELNRYVSGEVDKMYLTVKGPLFYDRHKELTLLADTLECISVKKV